MLQAGSFAILFFIGSVSVAGWVLLRVWSEVAGLLHMDWLEGGFLAAVSLVICIGWIGVILASLGVFSLTAIALIVLLLSVGVLMWRRPMKKPLFARLTRAEIALLILLLMCAAVYFRPHEYVFGGQDVGTYVNIGATIARTGKFVLHEPWVEFLSAHSAVTLREQPAHFLTRHLQFVGWYIDDRTPSRIIPQFFPFHPALMAVGMQLAGIYGGLLVTPLWGVLGLAAVYLLARRLFDAKVALLTAGLLAISPTQLYFSRYPTTEPLTLLLVFTALLAFQVSWDTGFASRAWGILFGGAFGAAFLTRIDLIVVFGCAILFLMLAWALGYHRSGWWAATLSFGVSSVYATASALLINWPYVWNTYGAVLRFFTGQPVFIGVAISGVLGGCVVVFLLLNRSSSWVKRLRALINPQWLQYGLVFMVLALSVYGYFVRPVIESTQVYRSWMAGSPIEVLDALNWVRIGWYITPLGLLLATVGLAGILWTNFNLRCGFFLAVGILTTLQYVYKAFIPSYHIYMMRRYVPVVLPMLMICVAWVIVVLLQARRRWIKGISIIMLVGLCGGLLFQSRNVGFHRDNAGTLAQITELHARLKPEAILVITEPGASLFSDILGVPLQFIFGRNLVTIYEDDASLPDLANDVLQYAQVQNRPVQLLTISPINSVLRSLWQLEPVEMFPVTTRYLEHTVEAIPSEIQEAYYGIEIYDVLGHAAGDVMSANITVDVGTLDAAYLVSGFYGKESLAGSPSMRWTADRAIVEIPVFETTSVEIEIRAMIYRPESVPPVDVLVMLDGQMLGTFIPTATWQTFTFTGDSNPEEGISELVFATSTFSPAALQVNTDTRDLGFLVDWISVGEVTE